MTRPPGPPPQPPGWAVPQQNPYPATPFPHPGGAQRGYPSHQGGNGFPPGLPRQGPPYHPPKKSKKLLITVLVLAGVGLLGGLGAGVWNYLDAHADGGKPPTGAPQPQLCGQLVSEQTRAALRVTNVDETLNTERTSSAGTTTSCSWIQTKGVDGEGRRTLEIDLTNPTDTSRPENQLPCAQRSIPSVDLGEAACLEQRPHGATMSAYLFVKAHGKLVIVRRSAWDVGVFDIVLPPPQEIVDEVMAVGEEVVRNLGGQP